MEKYGKIKNLPNHQQGYFRFFLELEIATACFGTQAAKYQAPQNQMLGHHGTTTSKRGIPLDIFLP